jgi:hypothetical protein
VHEVLTSWSTHGSVLAQARAGARHCFDPGKTCRRGGRDEHRPAASKLIERRFLDRPAAKRSMESRVVDHAPIAGIDAVVHIPAPRRGEVGARGPIGLHRSSAIVGLCDPHRAGPL